jgi:hypothetical protein
MIDSCSCSSLLVRMLMLKGYSLCTCSFILISSLHFEGVARNVSRCVVVALFGGSAIADRQGGGKPMISSLAG